MFNPTAFFDIYSLDQQATALSLQEDFFDIAPRILPFESLMDTDIGSYCTPQIAGMRPGCISEDNRRENFGH